MNVGAANEAERNLDEEEVEGGGEDVVAVVGLEGWIREEDGLRKSEASLDVGVLLPPTDVVMWYYTERLKWLWHG